MAKNNLYKVDTQCVTDHQLSESGQSHVIPIHATSSYSYKSIQDSIDVFEGKKEGHVYSRFSNPTVSEVEDKLAALEAHGTEYKASCWLTSSGLAAISTFAMSILEEGDEVLTQPDLYGGTTEVFSKIVTKCGNKILRTDLRNLNSVEDLLKSNPSIKLIYFETPSNPMLRIVDIQGIVELAKQYNCLTAIDNTFCTFYLQKPMQFGVDFILYSTTKYLNGHGNAISGAIICKNPLHGALIFDTRKLLGTTTNAWDAWLLHNGLKTLPVRMDRHSQNAIAIATYLSNHPKVLTVNYPGLESHSEHSIAQKQMLQFGGMLSFEIKGGLQSGIAFMDGTEICTIAATLGNVDTLLLHPATSSHLFVPKEIREQSGITDGLVRISVGIENVDDLIGDIEQGLA